MVQAKRSAFGLFFFQVSRLLRKPTYLTIRASQSCQEPSIQCLPVSIPSLLAEALQTNTMALPRMS